MCTLHCPLNKLRAHHHHRRRHRQHQHQSINQSQWVARLTRNEEVVGSSLIKRPRGFLKQDTFSLIA